MLTELQHRKLFTESGNVLLSRIGVQTQAKG